MANVIRVCSPGDFHVGEYILAVEERELFAGGLHEITFRSENLWMTGLVERL